MRIGIDARELCGRSTGVGRYLGGLVREWAADPAACQHAFVLYAPEPLAMTLDPARFTIRLVPGAPGTWWEQVRLPRAADEDRLDVFFAPAYTAPLDIDAPVVVAIHDLSFVAHPEWFRIREGIRRRWLTRQSAARARAVVTISEFSRGELVDLGVPDARIRVIPPGIGPSASGLEPQASGVGPRASGLGLQASGVGPQASGFGLQASGVGPQASGLGLQASGAGPRASGLGLQASGVGPQASGLGLQASGAGPRASGLGPQDSGLGLQTSGSGPRVLFVGSMFNRRHVPDLIAAFAPIARTHRDASLDLVGDDRSFPREDLQRAIDAEGLHAQAHWHQYATDRHLGELYARARAFAFLSEYEGLGLTPLEALAAGVPPVLLDTAVARESCGDAALYVPLNDRRATTRALEAVLFDEATRSRLLEAAPVVLAKYDWARAARETLAVLLGIP